MSLRCLSLWMICVVSLLSFDLQQAHARLATAADLPYVVELDQTDMAVDSQGRTKMTRLLRIRINNDQGRESESVQTIPFNARSSSLKILDARTLNGKSIKRVSPKNIEFKEVGDTMNSFDAQKQAILAFPDVQIGSKVELRYEITNKEVAIPGFWSSGLVFAQEYIEDFRIKIKSDLPLYSWKQDEKNLIGIRSSKSGKYHLIEARSTAPIAKAVAQEEFPFTRAERALVLTFSSLPNWNDYAKSMIPVHERLLSKPLPPTLERIRAEAAKEKSAIDKLQRVTALISQEFRYFGDWRRRHGGYVPRTLGEIADTRYGDCKDLSLITTAIYRALGFKANLAWIWRGEVPLLNSAYTLPVDTFFNHAVTRVEDEAGKVYWIDATNPVSYAHGPFTDIAGRAAFVLDKTKAFLDRTPELDPKAAIYESDLKYELRPDQSVAVQGDLRFKGRTAIGMTIKGFYGTVERVNYELVKALAFYGKVLDYSVGEFERRSRIVSDLVVPIKFTTDDIGLRTSAGFGFPLMREDVITRLLVDTRDRVSDVYLDVPNTLLQRIRIAGVKRVGRVALDCELKTEWINLSRKISDTADGVEIRDNIEVVKHAIPVERLETPEFTTFQRKAKECFNRAAVILDVR